MECGMMQTTAKHLVCKNIYELRYDHQISSLYGYHVHNVTRSSFNEDNILNREQNIFHHVIPYRTHP